MAHSLFLSSANDVAALRVQSNLARGIFQQVVILPRLTCRLYIMHVPITVSQLAVSRKLLQDAIMESATNTVVLRPILGSTTGMRLS
jgi:hypothetical protein